MALAVVTAAGAALAIAAETFTGRVVGVLDGDTLEVLRDGRAARVRLVGIDAPEKGQAFGRRAKEAASTRAFGQDVTVQVRGRDRYGRTLGEVLLPDGTSLNEDLVRDGFAWWFRRYAPGDARLAALEDEARTQRRGLWADPDPVPPWDFRRGGRP